MRRRGPFRRPFRRPGPRQVPPELRHANDLMENAQYPEAASAFAHIAEQAERRRGPRAPIFHLRAGRAYAQASNPAKAMPHIKKGLGMIAARRNWAQLQRFGQLAVDELNELGFNAEAQEIVDYLASVLPAEQSKITRTESRSSLPTHCPGCGAPIRADEVDWIDNKTTECIYCGSPVQGVD